MTRNWSRRAPQSRRGATMILVAGMVVGLVVLTAMVIDVGYVATTKTQLQAASDSAALAGGLELYKGLGAAPQLNSTQTQSAAATIAADYASRNRAGDRNSVIVNSGRDVRFGNARFVSGSWQRSWGTQPYNMIGVSALRNQTGSSAGDGPLPLFFGGIVGARANVSTTSSVALMPATTFKQPAGNNVSSLLPFAIDEASWNSLMSNTGPDAFNYNKSTGQITSGSDGVKEADMYPGSGLGPGNRGTIDLGGPNNSTSDLKRQISSGLNASDFSYFPNGEIKASTSQPLVVNGDTGISAGMKGELESIIGKARTMAVFSSVSGNGNNSSYTVIKFVGIRIVDVKLSGNPKHVWIQPATIVDPGAVGDITAPVTNDSVFAPIMLIE